MTNSINDLLDELSADADFSKDWSDELESIDVAGLTAADLDNLVHTLLSRRLVEALRDPVRCTPGLLQCALRFLKDNDITALPIPGSAHAKLKARLGDNLPFPRMTGTDS